MDDLDQALRDAWYWVMARCRADPAEAERRFRRVREGVFARPPRAWCLALRAGDRRIGAGVGAGVDENDVAYRAAHAVTLDGAAIRRLCEPVRLDYPGVTLTEAAERLGRHAEGLRHWLPVRPGRRRADRQARQPERWEWVHDERFPLRVRYEAASCFGHFGYDVPVVWCDRLLDPGSSRGESPHPVWGSFWPRMAERLPAEYELTVERVPRVRPYRDEARFRGWDWICPGRAGVDGEHRPCGRRCMTLYGPLPMATIGHFLDDGEGLAIAAEEARMRIGPRVEDGGAGGDGAGLHLAGRWYPGIYDPLAGQRSFACERCWGVRRLSLCGNQGWNDVVTYLSGGLLYGRDVQRPVWLTEARKQAPRRPRAAAPWHVASGF